MKSKFMSNDQKKSEIYKLNLKLDKLKKDLAFNKKITFYFLKIILRKTNC